MNTKYVALPQRLELGRTEKNRATHASERTKRIKLAACVTLFASAAVFAATASTQEATGSGPRPASASGSELFETNCARCHGPEGRGGKGPNLASEKRQAKWRDSDAKLIKKITSGGMFMPSFGKKLKPEEIKAIADHVRTLKE